MSIAKISAKIEYKKSIIIYYCIAVLLAICFCGAREVQAANVNFTVSVWVKANDSAASKAIVVKNNEIRLATDANGRPVCQIHNGAAWQAGATSSQALSLNTWQYIACAYDGSNIKVYIDAAEAASLAKSDDVNNTANPWRTGSDAGAAFGDFKGFIDEVKIYPYARSADEIRLDYNAGKAGVKSNSGVSASFGGSSDSWMSDGLVGYWKMDESATTSGAVDSSGNGNTGAYYGNASTTGGKFGNGGAFDGTGDQIRVSDSSSLEGMAQISFGAWIYYQGGDDWGRFIDKQDLGYSPQALYQLEKYGSSDNIGANIGGVSGDIDTGVSFDSDQWQHVFVVYNGSEIKVYKNGSEIYSDGDFSGNISTNDHALTIGSGYSDAFIQGKIDEVRIYNRVLSEAEVRKLYEWAPGPVAHWKFDEHVAGDGQTIYDSAASTTYSGGNHGTTNSANGTGMDCTKPGKYGTACEFDGVDDWIDLNSPPVLENMGPLSISFWINANNDSEARLFTTDTTASGGWVLYIKPTNSISFEVDSGGNMLRTTSNNVIQLNKWHHIMAAWDGSMTAVDAHVYIDGIESTYQTTQNGSGTWTDVGFDKSIGGRVADSYFNGLIDDVRIYNYARTQKQILEDMNAGGPAQKSPVLHLSFDEGYGATAYDKSIHGNNGSLQPGTGGTNTASSAMWSLDGKYGRAMEFDGVDDYVGFGDVGAFNWADGQSFTYTGWFNRFSFSDDHMIIGETWSGVECSTLNQYHIGIDGPNDTLIFHIGDGTDNFCMESSKIFTSSGWNFFTVVFDADSTAASSIYINGVLDTGSIKTGTAESVNGSNNTRPFNIGAASDLQHFFNGLIDEVKIWNYALTPEEIKTEYNQGVGTVMGSLSTPTAATSSNATSRKYCVPGSTDYCAPPVGEWKFDEKTGNTAYDTSGQGNDGTLTWMATSTNGGWRGSGSCKFGNCLIFDGTDDYVKTSQNSILKLDNGIMTISAWIYMEDWGESTQGRIIAKGDGSTRHWWLQVRESGGPTKGLQLGTDDGGGLGYAKSENNIIDLGSWYHVTVTRNGGQNVGFYVNGQLKTTASDTTDNPLNTNAEVYIGSSDSTDREFDGKIDDVRVYNYARTPAQIAWDYNKGKPIAEWRFDECSGDTIYDESGNANHGTLNLGASGVTATGTCASSSDSFWYNGRSGKYNGAGSFDGDSDYIIINDNAYLQPTYEASVSVWYNASGWGESGYGRMVSKRSGSCGTTNCVYDIGFDNNASPSSVFCGFFGTTTSSNPWFEIDSSHFNAWHQIICTTDTYNTYMYLDGELVDVDPIDIGILRNNGDDLYIGNRGLEDRGFDGLIDEVKVWNYALTADQVRTEYNGGAVRFGD